MDNVKIKNSMLLIIKKLSELDQYLTQLLINQDLLKVLRHFFKLNGEDAGLEYCCDIMV
jgi:hypothetical protein